MEILTRERETVGQKRVGPFASPRVVVPLRGGGLHEHSSRARTSSAFFPSSQGGGSGGSGSGVPGLPGTEVTPIRAKFASKEAEMMPQEDVVVTFSPIHSLGQDESKGGDSKLELKPQEFTKFDPSKLLPTGTPERRRKASETLEFPISGLSTFDDDDDGPQPPPHLNLGAILGNTTTGGGSGADKPSAHDPTSPQRRSSLLQRIFTGKSPAILKTKFTKSTSGSSNNLLPPESVTPTLASPTSSGKPSGGGGSIPPVTSTTTPPPPPTTTTTSSTSTTTTGGGGGGGGGGDSNKEPPSPQRGLSLNNMFKRK